MFGLFGKKKPAKPAPLALDQAPPAVPPSATPTGSADDEASERFLQMILVGLQDERGVSIETALVTLGALAGFSVQVAMRLAQDSGRLPPGQSLIKIECRNGDVFYTGDILNPPLLETDPARTSVFRMTAQAAHEIGARGFPDLADMVGHMANTYGDASYGMPRVPAANLPRHAPRDLLRDSWDTAAIYLRMQDKGDPLVWPFWLATVIQKLVRKAAGAIDPQLVTPLVMDTALAMSRVDPETIVGRSRHDGPRAIDLARTDLGKLLQSDEFGEALNRAAARERG